MRCFTLLLCLLAAPLFAQDPSTRVEAGFDAWLTAHDVPEGVLVLMDQEGELAAFERGIKADTPVDLQSNSKAITALCVAALVEDGTLTWDRPLNALMDSSSDLTMAELVTHTAGLTRDQTQWRMAVWRNDSTPRWHEATMRALDRTPAGPRGVFAYNNENYAILGHVIEVVTGEAYDQACQTRVLAPAGVTTGRLSPVTGSFGPWGGWQMSARDYARFHRHYFVGQEARTLPLTDLGGGAFYGLGMLAREAADNEFNRWHFGLLCFLGGSGNGGSFTVNWGGGYSLFAAYSACVPGEAMVGLDRRMIEALFSEP